VPYPISIEIAKRDEHAELRRACSANYNYEALVSAIIGGEQKNIADSLKTRW
jgi:hypothetical protein